MSYRASWCEKAPCLNMFEIFFPPPEKVEKKLQREKRVNEAKEICRVCPFREQCLVRAVEMGVECGVWGGVDMGDSKERKAAKGECLVY